MPKIGYAAMSEEHGPEALVAHIRQAEACGADYAMISDHYHPWTTTQGESPFIWGLLGAVSQGTDAIPIGTAVTAPIIRIHPAVIAQAAATAACQLHDRFRFGVGTGENLNEHITGDRWPPHDARLSMLEEAIEIINLLWEGGEKTYRGEHYTVENAQIFTLPDQVPPIIVAAGGERAAAAAGHYGNGLMSTAPKPQLVDRFELATNRNDVTHYGQLHARFEEDADAAAQTAHHLWPNSAITGELGQELPTPAHFEQAAEMITPEDMRDRVICGADPDEYIESIQSFIEAGYDHVHLHQIGDNQEAFLEFFTDEIVPSF